MKKHSSRFLRKLRKRGIAVSSLPWPKRRKRFLKKG